MKAELKSKLNTTLSVLTIIVLFGALNLVRGKVEERGMLNIEPTRELLYLPDWQALHAMTLCEDVTAADLLWIRGVFYMSAQRFEAKQLRAAGIEVDDQYGSHNHAYCQEQFHFKSDQDELDEQEEPEEHAVTPDSINFKDYDFREHPVIHEMLFWNIGSDDARHLNRLLENVTILDPLFATPYLSGSMNLAIMAGRPEEALLLLNRGLEYRPDSWEIYYHRGFIKLFYYNDKIGAAEDIKAAAMRPGALPIVISLAASLQAGLNGSEFALDFLQSLSEISGDEKVTRQVEKLLERYKS